MKIELVDRQTVKILLSPADMQDLSITYEQMDYQDPSTKRAIVLLLQKIRRETAVDLSGGKLFIEAFPHCEGGCVLYISVLSQSAQDKAEKSKASRGFHTPLIFRFADAEDLISVCGRLFQQYSHLVLKSSLFVWEAEYYLLLYSYFKMDAKLITFVSEYGSFWGKDTVKASFLKEHAQPILEQNAVETIVERFCF